MHQSYFFGVNSVESLPPKEIPIPSVGGGVGIFSGTTGMHFS